MSLENDVVVVSGLPRSGTSLMMQMLNEAGIRPLTDSTRRPDEDNPRGYFEFELAKRTKQDASWLPRARGGVVKIVSALLYDLPPTENYRIIFMERQMSEVLDSQEKMLRRLNQLVVPRNEMRRSFELHLERLFDWLAAQRHMRLLKVSYNRLVSDPELEIRRVAAFLDQKPSSKQMQRAIDTSLYRNRVLLPDQ